MLLAAVVSSQPDLEAWHALETIAAHECGSGVGAFLASSLTESLKRLPPETRQFALSAVANLIAQECTCTRQVLEQLATSTDASARHLARSVANRVPGLLMREVLESLLSDSAPKQAIEWLRWLAKGKESNPAVLEVLAERERGVCLRCSRCNGQFARAEMIQHLWSAHGLVLDKRRPRDPWDVIDDWIAHYRRRHDEKLLQRCYELGQRWNPKLGLLRVYRRFLAGG
ncbi:MAG TPA: hypothetical protein VKE94_21600, partial [Gemmataceae bacterium]|nr:hypothetical protein [Gemmataceae bacterium]